MRSIVISVLCLAAIAAAQMTTTLKYKPNMRLRPFTWVPSVNYSIVHGATVSIEDGFAPGDQLLFDYEGEFRLRNEYNKTSGILYITGTATLSEYSNAIKDVVFTTTATDGASRRITWSFGDRTMFITATRHYYRAYADRGVSWFNAKSNCEQTTFMGLQGYLATISSQREMDALSRKLNMSVWLGASRANMNWTWMTGPEQGTQFWAGPNMYKGGWPMPWTYNAWGRFQPSNEDPLENYAALQPSSIDLTASWHNYDNSDGVQGYLCEFGGLNWTDVNVPDSYHGSQTLEFGCSLFSSSDDCNNQKNFGCAWTGATCQQSRCRRYDNEAACVGDAGCDWNVEGNIGVCANTLCSRYASDEPTCTADIGCKWAQVGASYTCVKSTCRDMGTSCQCTSLSSTDCVWRWGKCNYRAGLDCDNMDVVYVLDGTATMRQPFGLHQQGFAALTSAIANTQQVLTRTRGGADPTGTKGQRVGFVVTGRTAAESVVPSNIGSGGLLTGSYSDKKDDLEYLSINFAGSSDNSINTALNAAAYMFGNSSSGTRKKVVVIVSASNISDVARAKADGMATLASVGATVLAAELLPTPVFNAAEMVQQSFLVDLIGNANVVVTSIEGVSSRLVSGVCNAGNIFGKALNPTTQATCWSYMTKNTCRADKTCAWSDSANKCERSQCQTHCGATDCGKDATCAWDNTDKVCTEKCASQTVATCDATFCSVENSACVSKPCFSNPTEDACIADPAKCFYNATDSIRCRPVTCPMQTSSSTCAATSGCTWVEGKQLCVADPCSSRPFGICEQLPQCAWTAVNGSANVCMLAKPCAELQKENDCANNFNCMWDTASTPAICAPAPCVKYNSAPETAKTMCDANAQCKWRTAAETGTANRCEVKTCSMLTRSCDCAKEDACVWRDNKCRDVRYVMCPAVDLFFLVEGTPRMTDDFGRHPDGFLGLMETLRSWSRDAPWAADAAAAGFRMGMALYGANNSALAVPAVGGPGNGANFVSSGSSWYDSQGVINYFQDKVTSYSAGAQAVTALQPGLRTAKAMFKNSAPKRKKVLVILGASPITDGKTDATALGPIIEELELMGVTVFSNIVRRFATIAPVEQQAAMFMQPIATDPASKHFLFASIDNIRSSLLDNFCDPSTTTGQLLNVNRNDTLPCNWLGKSECNMQSSCVWDAQANVTCPLPGQCPNLDCQTLPSVLASKFNCSHCRLVSGAFQCSYGKRYVPSTGICVASPCATGYCDSTTCAANTSCVYETSMGRCGQNICGTPATANVGACNAQFGCYWNGRSTPAACVRSNSWRYRNELSCTAYTETENSDELQMYRWFTNSTPAVCVQKRCENYGSQTECGQYADQGCWWNPSSSTGRYCLLRACPYTTSIDCQADSGCYWNPYDTVQGECKPVPPDGSCVLSKFSAWSPCTATCGNAIQFKRRRILRFPTDKEGARSCAVVAADMSSTEPDMVQSRACSVPTNCQTHCAQYNNSLACSRDISCLFNLTCQAKLQRSCAEYTSEGTCNNNTGVCQWSATTSFCEEVVTKCTVFNTSTQCMDAVSCTWRTGVKANAYAATMNAPVQLYNPGTAQRPIFAFPELKVASNVEVWGGAVTIEKFFQRGKDKLELLYPSAIATRWDPASGTLHLSGRATVSDYVNAIRYVTFRTTSTRTNPRLLSWSLMNSSVYSGATQHWYRYFNTTGLTWAQAQANCQRSAYFGRSGYLAVVTSASENELISAKLGASGWVGGDDVTTGIWRWANGPFEKSPLQFWEGQSAILGGHVLPNMYANWDSINNEPTNNQTLGNTNHIALNDVGYWVSKNGEWTGANGYVCEYGGMVGDQPTMAGAAQLLVGGSAVIGLAGCMPQTCTWHTSATACDIDPECRWSGNQCVQSCGSQSSPAECSAMSNCKWDTSVLPPVCSANPCTTMTQADCDKSSRSATGKCTWSSQFGCMFKTGCATRDSQPSCDIVPSCQWTAAEGLCTNKACTSLSTEASCAQNPLCIFGAAGCVSALCRAGNKDECLSSNKCDWSEGNGEAVISFTVGGQRVRPFASGLNPPSSVAAKSVDGATIMITSGFQRGFDVLSVNETALDNAGFVQPDLTNVKQTGALVLIAPPSYDAFQMYQFIQQNVFFSSTAKTKLPRTISYSLGANMVWSATLSKFIKYIPAPAGRSGAADFAAATKICSQSTFFGNNGSMAMFVDEMDTLNVAKFQPSAWIGAEAGTNNEWHWTAMPSWTFWNIGNANLGPVTNANGTVFAFWAGGQPKAVRTGKMYGFMTATGRWKTVVDGESLQAAGVMCMYDRVIANGIQATKQVAAQGCFVKPCITLTESQCVADATCTWSSIGNTCSPQNFCPKALTPSDCSTKADCFWNFGAGICSRMDPTVCSGLAQNLCSNKTAYPSCAWMPNMVADPAQPNGGACIMTGCSFRSKAACSGDSSCMWASSTSGVGEGQCIRKNCGLPTPGTCFADPRCEWNQAESTCQPSSCITQSSRTTCEATDSCRWNGATCEHARCKTTAGSPTCMTDPDCFYDTGAGQCTKPVCNMTGEATCDGNPLCFFLYKEPADDSTCIVAQCVSFKSQAACQGGQDAQSGRQCRWENSACRELTNQERRAAAAINACSKEVSPSLWWLWLLCAIILLLLVAIVYRLYLAYSKGLSFFEPTRHNVKYSPHQQYAEDLFEEAQQTAVETNVAGGYQKPNINDL